MIPDTSGEIPNPAPKMLDRIDEGFIVAAAARLPWALVFRAIAVLFAATTLACCSLAWRSCSIWLANPSIWYVDPA
jgi:hypothetical protein